MYFEKLNLILKAFHRFTKTKSTFDLVALNIMSVTLKSIDNTKVQGKSS